MLKTAWSVALLSTCTVVLSCVNNFANALTFQTYTDRASWLAAIDGTITLEDFNSFTADQRFGGSSVTAGSLVLSSNANQLSETLIDVKPYNLSGASGIDNTPLLNINGLGDNENLAIKLPGLSSAFGFDFENYDSNDDRATIIISGQTVDKIPSRTKGRKGFFGVVATDGLFDQVNFAGSSPLGRFDGTYNAIDNIAYAKAAPAPAPVPEPSAASAVLALPLLLSLSQLKKRFSKAL